MDSPKCQDCLFNGKLGQTYKIAGRRAYQCHDCGVIYDQSSFEEIEFKWKTDKAAWEAWFQKIKKERDKANSDRPKRDKNN